MNKMKQMYERPIVLVVKIGAWNPFLETSQTGEGGSTNDFDVKGIASDNLDVNLWDDEW
ncbi:MAG: hypothetical protein IJS63_03920 [Bacteroidaceae bacterium]|nr:hypothetical protein [Bacteroidaceae bacterium]